MNLQNKKLKTIAIIDTNHTLLVPVYIWVFHQLQWVKHLLKTPVQYNHKIKRLLQEKNSLPPRDKTILSKIRCSLLKHRHKISHYIHVDILQEKQRQLKRGLPHHRHPRIPGKFSTKQHVHIW